jgi:ribonuclease HIII
MARDVIGIDESGKGDYFGPLVAAGVYVQAKEVGALLQMGVRDSKRVSDGKALELDKRIRRTCVHEVVAIGPERYNSLYEKIKNLNRLLAWAHARVLENLLERVSCEYAMADKFGDERFIQNALMKKGRKISLEQRVRAEEEEIAVAAASIVARAEFLGRLQSLSAKIGVSLPKGAGPQVNEVARDIVRRLGAKSLEGVAKLHFKTTKKVLEAG